MLFDLKQKFLLKCKECAMIISVELDDEDDLKKAHDDEFVLQCPCGGEQHLLRD
jgi:hypothetical protein